MLDIFTFLRKHRRVGRLIVAAVVFFATYTSVHFIMGVTLKPVAIKQLEHITGGRAEITSIDFTILGYVRLNGLTVTPEEESLRGRPIIKARKVRAWFSLLSIAKLSPALKRLEIDDFEFNALQDIDNGRWNIGAMKLRPGPVRDLRLPNILAQSGKITYARIIGGEIEEVVEMPIELASAAYVAEQDIYGLYVGIEESPQFRHGNLNGTLNPGKRGGLSLTGSIGMKTAVYGNQWDVKNINLRITTEEDTAYLKNFSFQLGDEMLFAADGVIKNYKSNADYDVNVNIDNFYLTTEESANKFVYSRETLETINEKLNDFFEALKPEGTVDVNLNISGQFADADKLDVSGQLVFKGMSVVFKEFPYPVENLTGIVEITEDSAVLKDLDAQHGDIDLTISGKSRIVDSNHYVEFGVKSPNMKMNRDLYEAMNPEQKMFWFAFAPSGVGGIETKFIISPEFPKGKQILIFDLYDGRVIFDQFPYPLPKVKGSLTFVEDTVHFPGVTAAFDGRVIKMSGTVTEVDTNTPMVDIMLEVEDVPLDETLRQAMAPEQRAFLDDFTFDAAVDANIHVYSDYNVPGAAAFELEGNISGALLEYHALGLPMHDIDMDVHITPDMVQIKKLRSQREPGWIEVTGNIWPYLEDPNKDAFCLRVVGEDMALDDTLAGALPKSMQKTYRAINPSGTIDVDAVLNSNAPDCAEEYMLIRCVDTTISPAQLPYAVENINGLVRIEGDVIRLEDISAKGAVNLSGQSWITIDRLAGRIETAEGLISNADFEVDIPQVVIEPNIADKLPERISNFVKNSNAKGAVSVQSDDLSLRAVDANSMRIDFKGLLRGSDLSFGPNSVVRDINGVTELDLAFITGIGLDHCIADVRADGFTVAEREVNDLKGRLVFDAEIDRLSAERFIAQCCGGLVMGDFRLDFGRADDLRYQLQIGFNDMDAGRFFSPNEPEPKTEFVGLMNGQIGIDGIIKDEITREGRIIVDVRDVRVGPESFPGAIVSSIPIKSREGQYTFNRMDLDGYVHDSELLIERIDLRGPGLSLNGQGWVNTQSGNVFLDLMAVGNSVEAKPDLIGSLAAGLGRGVIQVKVSGPMNDAEIETKALPVLTDALGLLGTKEDDQGRE